MCGLYTKKTARDWLENQLAVLGCLTDDMMINPNADMSLVDCLLSHKKWLKAELLILDNPEKFRLSKFALTPVYPLLERDS